VKRAGQISVFVLCLVFTVSAVYNVFSDNAAVERMASAVACGDQGPTCNARITRLTRTPFGQTFEWATPKRTVGVKCVRQLVLVGEYSCTVM
jgi:hypothetical protein